MSSIKSAFSSIKGLKLILAFVLALTFSGVFANEPQTTEAQTAEHATAGTEGEGSKKFDAGKLIIHHVIDDHEWHIVTIGKTHVTIPLPIIIYSVEKGLITFCSNKLHDGHTHEGFRLANGHLEAVNADGTPNSEAKFYDFSMTKNVLALIISLVLLCIIFLSAAKAYTRNPNTAPKGIQSWVEPIIVFIRDEVAKPSIGDKKYMKYMPYLLTVFFFIWINNMMGLIPIFPGGANVTGNIAVTLVLALFTFIITTASAKKDYWIHVINTPGVPWWLKFPIPLMPIVELMGVFTKPFVLMVRLFANITAGHIIILGFISLIFIFGEMNQGLGYGVSIVSVAFSLFISMLELLVAFLQAYVFTLLSALYFGSAIEEHHHEDHH